MSTRPRFSPVALALCVILAAAGGATASLCSIDVVPAATLLFPYFQVDVTDAACGDPNLGTTTIISVRNAKPEPVLTHVTVWTNLAVPALDFDVYLAGYDTQVINVRDFFCSGNLPVTGAAVSNHGAASNPPVSIPTCNNTTTAGDPPVYSNPAISPQFRTHLKEWFSGLQSSVTGECAGTDLGWGYEVAVGYITVDVVKDCSLLFPSDPVYIGTVIGFSNTLLGDYQLVDQANNFAQGFNAVHIEADDSGLFSGGPTFYGRYTTSMVLGADGREPLPTTFAVPYRLEAYSSTLAIVWREANGDASPFTCGAMPSWWPLGHSNQTGLGAIVPFDADSNPVIPDPPLPGLPVPPLPLIPNATELLTVGPSALTTPFLLGWFHLNLQSDQTVYFPSPAGQAWVQVVDDHGDGRSSSGMDAFPLDGSCPFPGGLTVLTPGPLEEDPVAPFFIDGFESGNTSGWSITVP
jgi:hypothetical protein